MSEPNVTTEKNGPVTTVILRRPQVRNAVDRATAASLAEAFLAFERDDDARVGVLFGDHGTFCAGADLKAVATATGENRIPPPRVGDAFDRLSTDGPMGPSRMLLSKPVIAAVAGHAVAGGLELALWCDLRVIEEDAVFGVFCRRWGVPLVDGGTIRLPRLIGMGRALDLILTGRPVAAEEALQMASPTASCRSAGRAVRPSRWPRRSRASPSSACAPTGCRLTSSGTCRSIARSTASTSTASAPSSRARRARALSGSPAGAGVAAGSTICDRRRRGRRPTPRRS